MKRVTTRSAKASRASTLGARRKGPQPERLPAHGHREEASVSIDAMANELRLLHGARAVQEDETAD